MARLSKAHNFDIYNDPDLNVQTPDSTYHSSFDETVRKPGRADAELLSRGLGVGDGFLTESEEDFGREEHKEEEGLDGEPKRLVSNMTRTSISSLPDSMYPTDHERALLPMHSPYSQPRARPSFRRTQLTTPSPFAARSPRDSGPRAPRSKNATPRSEAKGSPRPRRQEGAQGGEPKRFPLVLLHVTLLPVSLPWPVDVMREGLPPRVMNSVQLLRSKASETLLQRGILIPHPKDDYELLEERLLEALELQESRITKCGHFRGRSSTSSAFTVGSEDNDSALGSSIEGLDGDLCSTCDHPISPDVERWTVRVFAANGLMRANTWEAAWNEMERVDVEILPWISNNLRMKLDMKAAELETHAPGFYAEEEDRQTKTEKENSTTPAFDLPDQGTNNDSPSEDPGLCPSPEESPSQPHRTESKQHCEQHSSLPDIYRRKDIPLSILLRNYLLLLLQDRRMVAACFAGLIGVFFALQPAAIPALNSSPAVLGLPDTIITANAGVTDKFVGDEVITAEISEAKSAEESQAPVPVAHSGSLEEMPILASEDVNDYVGMASTEDFNPSEGLRENHDTVNGVDRALDEPIIPARSLTDNLSLEKVLQVCTAEWVAADHCAIVH